MPEREVSAGERGLDPEAVRQWLTNQEAAGRIIEEERERWLAQLDEGEAEQLYRDLVSLPQAEKREKEPSPVLLAMRRCLERLERLKLK